MAKRNHSGLSLAAAAVGLAIFASVPVGEAATLDIGGGASNTGGNDNGAAGASFSGDDGSTSTGTATFGNSPNRTSSTSTFGSGSNGATTVTNFNNNSSGQAAIGTNSGSNTETATATFGTSPSEAGFTSSLGTGTTVGPDIGAVTAAGITGAIGQLSIGERQKLLRKCTSVLAAPQRYDDDVVSLCKVIASL
jgi:hypothetical protein